LERTMPKKEKKFLRTQGTVPMLPQKDPLNKTEDLRLSLQVDQTHQ
jgi:hypothetical protein